MSRDWTNSASNYLSVPDGGPTDITGTALTIAVWVNPDSIANKIISKENAAGSLNQYLLEFSGSKLQFAIADNASGDSVAGTTTPSTGVWTHCAGVKNGTGAGAIKVYLNGVEDGSGTSNRTIANLDGALRIGLGTTGGGPFDGRIAEVAIFNAALAADEVLALAKGVSPGLVRPGSLKGYWPIWGVAAPEIDLSGNVNLSLTGTLNAANHAPVGPPVLMAG